MEAALIGCNGERLGSGNGLDGRLGATFSTSRLRSLPQLRVEIKTSYAGRRRAKRRMQNLAVDENAGMFKLYQMAQL